MRYDGWKESMEEFSKFISLAKKVVDEKNKNKTYQQDDSFKNNSFYKKAEDFETTVMKILKRETSTLNQEISLNRQNIDEETQQGINEAKSLKKYYDILLNYYSRLKDVGYSVSLTRINDNITDLDAKINEYVKLKKNRTESLKFLYIQLQGVVSSIEIPKFENNVRTYGEILKSYDDRKSWRKDAVFDEAFKQADALLRTKRFELENWGSTLVETIKKDIKVLEDESLFFLNTKRLVNYYNIRENSKELYQLLDVMKLFKS